MDEVWIPVPSHEDYMVSSRGRVKSSRGKSMNGKISRGYRQITFATQGHKYETVNLHRLIAELFIPNPDSLPQVNHLNEDKLDNRVENLEWCTRSQNINWTAKRHKASAKPHRPIFVVSPSGHRYWFKNQTVAAKSIGATKRGVWCCLHGQQLHTQGFSIIYAD